MHTFQQTTLPKRVLIYVAILFCAPLQLFAQGELALTITPPLFQTTISPGETWTGAIKVINTNSFNITVYATPFDFQPSGEGGTGKFIPPGTGNRSFALTEWMEVSNEGFLIHPEETIDVPFTLRVPKDATPGGHYGALLIGTKSPEKIKQGAGVGVSSVISSLFLVRVTGDVIEKGRIREFSTERTVYQTSKANFTLRFENLGNVHILPKGNITLYNMWGKKRGVIPINAKVNFGNVLPESVRKFSFEWSGKGGLFDVGRYSAVATLVYGSDEKKNTSQVIYFWIIPIKPLATILGGALFFILFFVYAVRKYVKRIVIREKKEQGITQREPLSHVQYNRPGPLFFTSLIFAILFLALGVYFLLREMLVSERDYDVRIKQEDGKDILISRENAPKNEEQIK